MYDLIVWDFNGTLLDDVETGIISVNTLLEERGLPKIESKEQYQELFGFPIIDYYRRLGFDFEKESYEALAHEWVKLYLENLHTAKPRHEVIEQVRRLRKTGKKQTILSATEEKMLRSQLEGMGILELFDEVIGLSDIYAHSKKEVAKEWIKKQDAKSALLIGDSIHDLQVASEIGAHCILVTGGHQNRQTLVDAGALVCEPDELSKLIP